MVRVKTPFLKVYRTIASDPSRKMGPLFVFDSYLGETPEERAELLSHCMEALGQIFGRQATTAAVRRHYGIATLGGKARAKALSAADRKRIASKAAAGRWKNA